MARGWESKSVESQMESAKEQTSEGGRRELTNDEKEVQRVRQGLLLSRTYVLRQIEASSNERYQEALRQALSEIEQKLSKLDGH
ncbi:MAG TPA: hypothetical protein VKE93_03880 [Candidatus Angelobacter sp.]|nr:hypothetical protein [Candidatus Angelobacter sp.]